MESPTSDNLIQHATGQESVQPPFLSQENQSASMSAGRPGSRGFSLNITFRWRPFVFAIGVTPLSQGDRPARCTT